MARTGTHAVQAFTPQPVCAPARARCRPACTPPRPASTATTGRCPSDAPTLAHHFGDAGYATGYIGKWHLAGSEPVPPGERGGYDFWLAANVLEFVSDAYRTTCTTRTASRCMLPGYRSDALIDAAIRFVADHHDEPFFLFLSLLEPHHQNDVDDYPAPDGYAERYQGRWLAARPRPRCRPRAAPRTGTSGGYCGQVAPGRRGLRPAARRAAQPRPARRHDRRLHRPTTAATSRPATREYKRSCHDASIRVPLALRGPGFDGGGPINRPVSTDRPAADAARRGGAAGAGADAGPVVPAAGGATPARTGRRRSSSRSASPRWAGRSAPRAGSTTSSTPTRTRGTIRRARLRRDRAVRPRERPVRARQPGRDAVARQGRRGASAPAWSSGCARRVRRSR